jgi:UDP-glucose 4-epimerase
MGKRHALVTGGAGFIGSHLVEHLLDEGWRVTVLDDLSTGNIDNLAGAKGREGLTVRIGSADDEALLRRLADGVDTVFHLAAVVGVRKVMEDTAATIERNFHASETVLRICNLYRLRLLLASTSEVYGSSPEATLAEDDDAVIGTSRHRRWCYAAGKLLDEFHAYAYYYSAGIPVTIVRLFNTIGPRQLGRYGMVVPTFARQALADEPITVHGDGGQRRCFTHVRDVVRCLAALAGRAEAAGEIYNIGGGEEISILRLAERIRDLAGSASPIRHIPYSEVYGEDFVDMRRRRPDTAKLRGVLGFAPATPLEEALRDVIEDLRGKRR